LLSSTEINGNTAWQLAAKKGALDIFKKIWDWAIDIPTTEEIKNKLLLSTKNEGNTA
jgi:hypothetical protein